METVHTSQVKGLWREFSVFSWWCLWLWLMNTTLQPALGYTVFHETVSFTEAILLWSDITWLSRKIQEPVREVSLLYWSLWNIWLVIEVRQGKKKNWEIQIKLSKWRTFYSWSRAINYFNKVAAFFFFFFFTLRDLSYMPYSIFLSLINI